MPRLQPQEPEPYGRPVCITRFPRGMKGLVRKMLDYSGDSNIPFLAMGSGRTPEGSNFQPKCEARLPRFTRRLERAAGGLGLSGGVPRFTVSQDGPVWNCGCLGSMSTTGGHLMRRPK